MMSTFKPKNYNSVSPYFMVDDASRMIDLLINLFDGEVLRKYDKPDGKIMHVEVLIDDSVIMMSDATPDYPAITYWMHVYVPDVDTVFQKAIDLGCESIEAPQNKARDPDKRGTFRDFAGNMWSIATQLDS